MADEAEGDELLLDQVAGDESKPEEQIEGEAKPDGEDELEVYFGDEAAPASGERESSVIRDLRERLREQARENAELRKNAPQAQAVEIGPKPTLAGCEYDEDRLDRERDAWDERKRQAEAQKEQASQSEREMQEAWQRDFQNYQQKRAELKIPDVDGLEAVALSALSQAQQAAIVSAADNPALVLVFLGKNAAKLAEISKITNPLKLSAAVAKLELGLKVMPKRKAPNPEEIASGSAPIAKGSGDKELERLEKEAAASGDWSKVFAHNRKSRRAA